MEFSAQSSLRVNPRLSAAIITTDSGLIYAGPRHCWEAQCLEISALLCMTQTTVDNLGSRWSGKA